MNNVLTRKYFLISLVIHLGIGVLFALVIHNNRISKTFLVFGAHSKKPTHAIMKFSRRAYVPFVGGGQGTRKGSGASGRGNTGKRAKGPDSTVKKLAAKKEEGKRIKRRAKQTVPTIVKKEAAVLEKQTRQVALAAGVSVHKKLLIKKLRAEKLRKLKELEKWRHEEERREREELLRQAREIRLARLETERAKKAKLEQKAASKKKIELEKQEETRRIEEEKKKTVLAQRSAENDLKDEDRAEAEDQSGNPSNDLAQAAGDIFAENGQDIMEFNLLAESDQELRVYQRSIQNEVSRLWHPPVGVSKGTTCRVMFAVGRDGSIEKFEFVTKSKMLIYDLSILRVAKQFKFDNCLWGKRFTIDFCQ